MKTGVFKRVSYFAAALALAASGSVFVSGTARASSAGSVVGGNGNNVTAEMYVEVDNQFPVEWIGVETPVGTTRVEKVIDSKYAGIVSYDVNEEADCIVHGDKVGFGVVTCNYLDDDGDLLQSATINTHVYADPNGDPNPKTGEYLDVAMASGVTLKLSEAVGDYFDNPASIRPAVCPDYDEEEGPAITVAGDSVANAVVTAGSEINSGTICFYNDYSTESDEIAQLFIQVYKKPELKDLTLVAYGKDADKSTDFAIEDEGNLPPYTIVSSDENIVSVAEAAEQEDEMHPAYVLTAEGVGEATITVTYDTYGNPTQTFKVTVDETTASGVYTDFEAEQIDESTLSDVTISDFEATKRASADVILAYYDVNLLVKDITTGATVDYITEAESARQVVLAYPSDLPELADGYTRMYYVIRDHNGAKEILPAYDNGDGVNFYFYSDEFSTFALAYYDAETVVEETVSSDGATLASTTTTINPNTLDNVANYAVLTGAAAVVMTGTIVYLMKREA